MAGIIERVTGADLPRWKGRLEDFISRPERRTFMVRKLKQLIRDSFVPSKENINQKFTKNGELLFHKVENTQPIPEFTHQDRGCITYIYKNNEDDIHAYIGLSIMPEQTRVHELHLDKLKIELTNQPDIIPLETEENLGFTRTSGDQIAKVLAKLDKNTIHMVVNSVFSESTKLDEIPFYGRIYRGKEEMPLQPKNSDPIINEFEAGGIALKDGQLSICTYTELCNLNPAEHELIEQTIVVLTSDPDVQKLVCSQKHLEKIRCFVGVGYFTINGTHRYFVYSGSGPHQLLKMVSILNDQQKEVAAETWSVSVIELGGGFAGYVVEDIHGTIAEKGPFNANGEQRFDDLGHKRMRFFDFCF